MNEAIACASHPVSSEEMSFAVSLFVAAANGRVAPPNAETRGGHLRRSSEWEPDALLAGARSVLLDDEDKFGDEVPLTRAVSVIWHQYDGDERRQDICSRLVAFYSLMVRSNGALLEPWTQQNEIDSEAVVLNSAIVEAIARAPLNPNGQFVDSEFETLVRHFADSDGVAETKPEIGRSLPARSPAAIPVTNLVKELATHLFAFQASVAALPNADGSPQFSVLRKLCEGFAELGGNRSMQPILSRALVAQRPMFPWLRSARAGTNGAIEGLNELEPAPSVQEAARGELAVLGSLVELLRSFVGDTVTLQFLRTIWPLASFHRTVSSVDVEP